MKQGPPKWCLQFLRWFCTKDHLEEIEGDLFELFYLKATRKGPAFARSTFLLDVLKFFRWTNIKKPNGMKTSVNTGLWTHYFKISVRLMRKNSLFSFINVSGLVLGVLAFLILLFYYFQETSYDRFFQRHEQVYRVASNFTNDGQYQQSARSPVPLAGLFEESSGNNAIFARMLPWPGYVQYRNKDKRKQHQFIFADQSVFDVFPMEVVHGSLNEALVAPFSLVLTERKALEYFGSKNPVGNVLQYDEGSGVYEFNVVAVIKDLPFNTHLNIDFLASFKSLEQVVPWHDNWFYPPAFLYARFEDQKSAAGFTTWGQTIMNRHAEQRYLDGDPEIVLQALDRIHLTSSRSGEWKPNNTQINIHFFLILGAFILFSVAINYINLTTANNQLRLREVGIKKTMGSTRSQFICQYYIESLLMIGASMALAAALLIIIWEPMLGQLLNKEVVLSLVQDPKTPLWLLLGMLLLSTIVALYPALTTFNLNPVAVIRENSGTFLNRGTFRKVLVTIQFSISLFLILLTMLLVQQYLYLQSKRIGFEKNYRVALKMVDRQDARNYEVLKEQLSQLSFVENVAVSSAVVGLGAGFYGFNVSFPDRPRFLETEWLTLGVDEDYLRTYDIPLIDGREFDKSFATDERQAFILNETAAAYLGDTVVGERMELTVYTGQADLRKGKVIGVVADFHFQSLYEPIKPLIIYINRHEHYTEYLNIELSPENPIADQVDLIASTYTEFSQDKPAELLFIEDRIEQIYKRERASSEVIFWFTVLAIFIAALGAFGLATYSFRRRSKEIGVRKVLGASNSSITSILLKEYILLIALACTISWPLAYLASSTWLSNFAYSVEFGWSNYLLGLALLIAVVLLANLHQILWTVKLRPVAFLRND